MLSDDIANLRAAVLAALTDRRAHASTVRMICERLDALAARAEELENHVVPGRARLTPDHLAGGAVIDLEARRRAGGCQPQGSGGGSAA